ncbi:MAG: site-specific integrase [Bacteroidales bacterium]
MATARIYLQKAESKRTKENLCPVKLVVTDKTKRRYYSISERLYPEHRYLSEEAFNKAMSKNPKGKYKDIKEDFKDRVKEAEKVIHDILEETGSFSWEKFETSYLNKKTHWDNLFYAFNTHIENLKANDSYSYAGTFVDTMKAVKQFDNKNLTFRDITPGWLERFERWMRRKGRSTATVGIYTRNIRTLFNIARKEKGVKAPYPFEKYKPRTAKANKRALTASDISKLWNYKPKEGTGRHFAKDIFIFMFLANGMNIGDVLRLKYLNIIGNEIEFTRTKTRNKDTETRIRVPYTDTLKKIVDYWGQKAIGKDVYIFPVLDGTMNEEEKKRVIMNKRSNINKRLKKIANELELEHLSTVYARHSYATIMRNSGASTEYIQEQLGHTSSKTTQNYLASFEQETRQKNAKKLEQLLTG